jgi:Omp85 superfamily domain
MGALLALAESMRTLGLLVTLLVAAPQASTDQKPFAPEGTIIASAQVTGFDIERLSPGLREAIQGLAGTPLKQERLDELAARLEGERPRYVAAVRAVMEADGQARVFFMMGRQDDTHRDDNININGRYIVEHADITGVPEADIPQALLDDLRTLKGQRLDSGEAERLQSRIERELPDYEVNRRIERGTEKGRIRIIYEARKRPLPRWLRFEPLRSNYVYHSEQGGSAFLDLNIGDRNIRFTPFVAIDNADDLVEEYTGYGLRFETRAMGTRRLGASIEWSTFDQDWRAATLDTVALSPDIPALYKTRSTITPLLKFAFSPEVSIAGGVSVTELEPLAPATESQMANAAVFTLDVDKRWRDGADAKHRVVGSFGIRAGSRSLESDLSYTRYLGEGTYRFDFGRHHVQATGMAGGITGHAPLFERFTLGDSTTLRGWDKYDIAPAGGDRVVYSSFEYRYTGLALFLDVGSVWDANTERRVRVSAGFGFHGGPAFLAVGFPLNTDNLTAVVTAGLRIPGIGIRW